MDCPTLILPARQTFTLPNSTAAADHCRRQHAFSIRARGGGGGVRYSGRDDDGSGTPTGDARASWARPGQYAPLATVMYISLNKAWLKRQEGRQDEGCGTQAGFGWTGETLFGVASPAATYYLLLCPGIFSCTPALPLLQTGWVAVSQTHILPGVCQRDACLTCCAFSQISPTYFNPLPTMPFKLCLLVGITQPTTCITLCFPTLLPHASLTPSCPSSFCLPLPSLPSREILPPRVRTHPHCVG